MTKIGSIKETGEEVSDEKWRRFEAEANAQRRRQDGDDLQTDQPYREEAEQSQRSDDRDLAPDHPDKQEDTPEKRKTTQRTE